MSETFLPYAGTSGWSGSDTSRERALRDDSDGTTTHRQWQAIAFLEQRRVHGATWKELAEYFGWHHGQASSVLSVLHKVGRIERLDTRRARCGVYVLPQYVGARDVAARRARKCCPHCGGAL